MSVPPWARRAVIVEGLSDRVALEALARRREQDLRDDAVAVVAIGGAKNIGRFLRSLARRTDGLVLAGLYDAGEIGDFQRAFQRSGRAASVDRNGLEELGFYMCDADLEDELIRALGSEGVERVIAANGELRSLRILQQQPAQRGWTIEQTLHRFMGSRGGRKIRYAGDLVDALDLDAVPRPLAAVLDRVTP